MNDKILLMIFKEPMMFNMGKFLCFDIIGDLRYFSTSKGYHVYLCQLPQCLHCHLKGDELGEYMSSHNAIFYQFIYVGCDYEPDRNISRYQSLIDGDYEDGNHRYGILTEEIITDLPSDRPSRY